MEKYKAIISLAAMLIVASILYFVFSRHQPPKYSLITDFAHCAAAGYPVTESSPRSCHLPDGEVFVEPVQIVQQCGQDSQCGAGQYCDAGQCQNFVPNVSCRADSDCKLVDESLMFGCCWAGVCKPVDYSEGAWIAVSRQWFADTRSHVCGMQEQACGPRPACSVQLVNDNYSARCIGNVCYKRPVSP